MLDAWYLRTILSSASCVLLMNRDSKKDNARKLCESYESRRVTKRSRHRYFLSIISLYPRPSKSTTRPRQIPTVQTDPESNPDDPSDRLIRMLVCACAAISEMNVYKYYVRESLEADTEIDTNLLYKIIYIVISMIFIYLNDTEIPTQNKLLSEMYNWKNYKF